MGNHDSKLRGSVSLPPENFPSMRLDNSGASWTNKGYSEKLTRSFDNLDKLGPNVSVNSQSVADVVPDEPFLPVYKRDPEINESHFSVVSVIAKGVFGDVLQVRRLRDNVLYAMKVMHKKRLLMEKAVQQSKDEATIQDAVGYHPMVVKPFWFFQNSSSVFIVMEYIPCGELFAAWKNSGSFNESVVRIYVAELGTVLDFLHKSGIIYRDLKMENILLDTRGHLHITDFGLAKRLKKGQRTNTICGTLQYIAPEVVNAKPYGHATDWWSLGILAFVLLSGKFPLSGMKDHFEMVERMSGVRYELPPGYNFSPQIRHLVSLLLQMLPENRLTDLDQMKQHSFFSGFNFEGMMQMEIKSPRHKDMNVALESRRHLRDLRQIHPEKTHAINRLKWKEPVASLSGLYV